MVKKNGKTNFNVSKFSTFLSMVITEFAEKMAERRVSRHVVLRDAAAATTGSPAPQWALPPH